jgi:preprotein translocase subunit SecF
MMKKTLIFILLNVFCLQYAVFATIQKAPIATSESTVLKTTEPKLSFKQRVMTYFLQRKIQRIIAKSSYVRAAKDSTDRNCVKIVLKRGTVIFAQISSMDEKNITYQLCEQSNRTEGTISLANVSQITDSKGRMIFNNESKPAKLVSETKGRKYANISLIALLVAAGAVVLTIIAIAASFGGGNGSNSVREFFSDMLFAAAAVFTFVVSILVSFIMGIMALIELGKSTNENSGSKVLAGIATVISGLVIFFTLLGLAGGG